ncbi:Negative regulator of mitotic exit [Mortierella sp. GBA30]|nr:Negative regulator of mitotic exit [Mortierella sp. GBA30]
MAFASAGETALYIQGGKTDVYMNGEISNQFYVLDLTQAAWDTSSPPWKALNLGTGTASTLASWQHSMTLDKNQRTLVTYAPTLGVPGISTFDIADDAWTATDLLFSNAREPVGLQIVTDPRSDLYYVIAGTKSNKTLSYNIATGAVQELPPPLTTGYDLTLYSAVWSTLRNKMLLFGGRSGSPNYYLNEDLLEFDPSNSSWKTIITTGNKPDGRIRHCIVPVYDGTQMVVFGGNNNTMISMPSIYILDLKTRTWTRGVNVARSQARAGMACAVVEDYFIAWGGEHVGDAAGNVSVLGSTVVYNLKSGQWTNQVVLSLSSTTDVPPQLKHSYDVSITTTTGIDAPRCLRNTKYYSFHLRSNPLG